MSVNILKKISVRDGGNNTILILFSQDTLPEGNVSAPQGSIFIYSGIYPRVFTKSTGSDSNGWRPLNKRYGTTASRLPLTISDRGFDYFDTTLGKPVWWNGTEYIDITPNATTSVKGLVNQGVHVPDGSSVDTLLASLRAAGIIASS